MSYDLSNINTITYDGADVEKLTLDGAVIWEGLDQSLSVVATYDDATRMITVTVTTGKSLQRWYYEARFGGNIAYSNAYYPIYAGEEGGSENSFRGKTIQLGRDKATGDLSPISTNGDGTWEISVTGYPSNHESSNIGVKSVTVEVTTEETMVITNLTPNATMEHEYGDTWGSVGHDDGAIIKATEPSNIDFYELKFTNQQTGELIRNWHRAHRFRVVEDRVFNFGNDSYQTHEAYKIEWGFSSQSYSFYQDISKSGNSKPLRFFVKNVGERSHKNNATADSTVSSNTAAPEGQRIWDCIRDIHANPSNYEVRDDNGNVETQMTTLLPDRIVDDFNKITFNKYFYSIPTYGSDGPYDGSTDLDFIQSPQKYTVQVRAVDYSNTSKYNSEAIAAGWNLSPRMETSNKLDITLTAIGLPNYNHQFGLPVSHNPKTTREPSLHTAWTYTIPAGMKRIEVLGVGGGGGSWGAHDGVIGQNTRPGGAGSGFTAKFEAVQWQRVHGKQLSLNVSSNVTLQSTENILQIVYGVGGSSRKFRYFTGFNPTTKKMTYDQYSYSTKESSGEFTISTTESSPTTVGRENDDYTITMWYSSSDKLLYLTTGASSLEDSMLSGNSESGMTGDYEHATYATATSLKEGDVLSGNWGSAGGSGYYSGGVGASGTHTTLKLNGTLLVTAQPGGNASGVASGANGVSIKASGWDSHATSIDLHQGTAYTGVLSGGDGSCPACGYDPWGYVNSPSYNVSHIGEPAFGDSYGGLAQMTGYIIINEIGEDYD